MFKSFSLISAAMGLIVGIVISSLIYLSSNTDTAEIASTAQSNAPLYWVAPMDANYRRDKPGKSPMGMDLVPVYAEQGEGENNEAGSIKISPEVVNNLGVRVEAVKMASLTPKMTTVGYIKYDEDRLIHIHPRVQGWIEKLFVKAEGDPVKKGEAIYELYSPELVNAQEEFLLALERNNQRLIRAARERLTALQLPAKSIQRLIDTRKVSQTITFYAPQSGVIDNLKVRQGFYVQPGTTLMSIGAVDQVWVETEIFERQLPFVYLNAPVTMTLNYLPGKQWQGKVDYIYPTINPNTRTAKLRLKFANKDGLLKPNMYSQVEIHARQDEEKLVVPREAVIRTGSQNRVVLAQGKGRFKSIAVTLGMQDSDYIEVSEGLKVGDNIVVSAQFLIDSESSKSSDFKRMHKQAKDTMTVWTSATIHTIDKQLNVVSATHEPIAEWQWPEMTMDFKVSNSVDISRLKESMNLHIEISRLNNNDYEISDIHIMDMMQETESKSHETPSTVVYGVVNQINLEERLVNISREAIPQWNREAATLDFLVHENIDMANFKKDQKIKFRFEVTEDFVLVEILEQPVNSHDGHH